MALLACESDAREEPPELTLPAPAEAELPSAPWAAPPLPRTAVPSVYLEEWTRAQNRASCALLALPTPRTAEASPRAATFSGGWAVAYDLPGTRSAFGVAGSGAEPDGYTYDAWPHALHWADGSSAGYGPEGGVGPNQLAYLRIPGQACLYNVWSRLGVEHLESILADLRFVAL